MLSTVLSVIEIFLDIAIAILLCVLIKTKQRGDK